MGGDLRLVERVPARRDALGKVVSEVTKEQIAEAQRKLWRRKYPLLDIGNGPWLVLENCPAERHNTYAAARGYARGISVPGVKCICPRGLAANEDYKANRRKNENPRGVNERHATTWAMVDSTIYKSTYYNNIKPAPVPDLSAGLCRTPLGMKIHDRTASITIHSDERELTKTTRAKELCLDCPVMTLCLADVERREVPGGSWGGVFGGLTPIERLRRSEGVER